MSNQDKLQAAGIAFEQWRNTRTHRTTKTPKALRQQAVKLLPHYPISQIIKTLKLSHAQLKGWNNGVSNKKSRLPPKPRAFVRLPEAHESSEPSRSLTLEWQLSDGVQWRLSGELSANVINTLVQAVSVHHGHKA